MYNVGQVDVRSLLQEDCKTVSSRRFDIHAISLSHICISKPKLCANALCPYFTTSQLSYFYFKQLSFYNEIVLTFDNLYRLLDHQKSHPIPIRLKNVITSLIYNPSHTLSPLLDS
jgi:hypothetical protein